MIILEPASEAVSSRALSLFTARVRRALRLRGEVSVRITSSRELRRLNRQFRHQDKPTDVLSFPAAAPRLAGDIAISLDIAAGNAGRLGHPLATELKILILHGLLHLAGYDHECDGGEMQAREARLRREFGLPTALIERTHGASGASPSAAAKKPRAHAVPQGRQR